jgi:hypothetical protein
VMPRPRRHTFTDECIQIPIAGCLLRDGSVAVFGGKNNNRILMMYDGIMQEGDRKR